MTEFRAYEEFIDFIAAGPSSEHVRRFSRPTPPASASSTWSPVREALA